MEPSFVSPPVPARPRGFGALMGDALRRPGGRKAVSALSVVLFIAGVAMFAYPVGTDAYSRYKQGDLKGEFGSSQFAKEYRSGDVAIGSPLTRLRIPRLKLDVLVVEGTTADALRAGAGHYVGTPLPGEVGNVAIAGHRTTFGRPFNRIDELKVGDQVMLETPFNIFHYKVLPGFEGHANPWPVHPKKASVIANVKGRSLLTLTTCHPKGSARQRLILRLELDPKLTEDVKEKGGTK